MRLRDDFLQKHLSLSDDSDQPIVTNNPVTDSGDESPSGEGTGSSSSTETSRITEHGSNQEAQLRIGELSITILL